MRRRTARGQSLTEVIVIVALVAIASIGLVGLYGDNMRGLFGTSSDAVAGNQQATNNGGASGGPGCAHKDLHTFGIAGSGGGVTDSGQCGTGPGK